MEELLIRDRVFTICSIIIRVPPLFVIDELLRIGLGVPDEPMVFDNTNYGLQMVDPKENTLDSMAIAAGNSMLSIQNWTKVNSTSSPYTIYSYQVYLMTIFRFLACCFGCVAAICTFMLWTKHLVIVYFYLMSVGIVFISYWFNMSTVEAVITYLGSKNNTDSIIAEILNLQLTPIITNGPGSLLIINYIFQSILAYIFCFLLNFYYGPKHPLLQKVIACSFIIPAHIGIYPLSAYVMKRTLLCATIVLLGVCKFVLGYNAHNIWKTLYQGYQFGRTFMTDYGLSALAQMEWARLHVPTVLRTFWILRVAEQVVEILINDYGDEGFNYYVMIKTLMVNGCETLTAVLGMASIISVICYYIGSFFHWVLLIDNDDDKNIGTVSAMLFYILALQTGLTSLDKENRLLRLCRNLCLLFTALLHFIHNIVNPLLMSLSASHNPALHRHIRALAVCVFLIVFPIWLLMFFWSHYAISTWLLAVSVFSIEVVVKVFVSLAIYSLFLYDAYRKKFWDELDDWVYIIRSFGNTVEFTFGIILFLNGFWVLVFEAGGTVRAFMMCVHAYFNLWSEAKAGWSVFMKRRNAVKKINLLPKATKKQLEEHADVCAICYQEMETARITKCNHFFHSVCLRKWLYVQDRCPLCHKIMYKVENLQENQRDSEEPRSLEPHVEENREDERERANNQANNNREEINNIMNNQNNTQVDCNTSRVSLRMTSTLREQPVEERHDEIGDAA